MGRPVRWILGAVGVAAVAGAVWFAAAEIRGRRAYREDMARTVECVDSSTIRLRDGRLLGFLMRGAPKGTPVLYFHGALGSRLEWPAAPDAAEKANVWLLAVDRPGYGCSTPQPGRTLLGWADDVRQLADRLGIGKFRIVAWSAGTPHALAVALRMPERVESLDLVGAAVPESYPEGKGRRLQDLSHFARLAQWAPGLAYAGMRRTVIRREREPEWFEERLMRGMPAVDRAVTASAPVHYLLKRAHASGESRIAAGLVSDLEALGGDWGFAPAQVKTPVTMWQGAEDNLTPAARNLRLTREFPHVQLKMFPSEGHFLIYRHEREILEGTADANSGGTGGAAAADGGGNRTY